MSIPRLLHILTLILFVAFVAIFFTVLTRLTRIGLSTERYAVVGENLQDEEIPVKTEFALLGQDTQAGQLIFDVTSSFDTSLEPISSLNEGDTIVLRIENQKPGLNRTNDLAATFSNPAADKQVIVDFGQYRLNILDRRDFYPFDGYIVMFNFAYHVPSGWFEPKRATLKSLTNLILLNPLYDISDTGVKGVRMYVARLRLQQFLTATLMLIEILFLLYLVSVSDLQDLIRQGLGYLVGLYIIREILTSGAPQFPTIVDYSTMFLICVTFFLMLFRFLGGAEEKALITLPPLLRQAIFGDSETPHTDRTKEDNSD
ncbi:MAG TPA: hypothetical protein VGB30_09645 [bacterium]